MERQPTISRMNRVRRGSARRRIECFITRLDRRVLYVEWVLCSVVLIQRETPVLWFKPKRRRLVSPCYRKMGDAPESLRDARVLSVIK